MSADMQGESPEHVLLVGVVGESFEPGRPLSKVVGKAATGVVGVIPSELDRLGVPAHKLQSSITPRIWWKPIIEVTP